MVAPSQVPKHHLSPINTHWHNRSLSSLSATSDTATFHSAHAHLSNMELRQLSLTQPHHPSVLTALPLANSQQPLPSPKLTSIRMDRQDSGYADSQPQSQSPTSTSHSRRTSASSSVKRRNSPATTSTSRPRKRTTNSSSSSNTSRPSTKRTLTQVRTSNPGSRPSLSSRYTTPFSHQQAQQPYQFFQFPSLNDSSPPNTTSNLHISPNSSTSRDPNPTTISSPPSPPPATVQYWTSDSTRRLEYAAIDAASKGVRGFFIKLLPDCILPPSSRRTKFHCDDDEASDAGSVRRYRLVLPEEKERDCCVSKAVGMGAGKGSGRRGMLRRWTSFGRRGGRMD